MFGRGNKEETGVSSYLQIFSRIGKLNLGTQVLFSVGTKQWRDELRKKAVSQPINKRIANNDFKNALVGLVEVKKEEEILARLSLLSGRCIQSEEEAENFLNGLASDAWAFKSTNEDIVKIYKQYPSLVWLRLLELIDG